MNKIAIFIILFAAVFACDPVIPEEEVILESSLDDYIEVIKCLLSNEPLIKDVSDLIAAIKAQDFTQLFAIAMRLYTDGKAALTECTKGEGEMNWKEDSFAMPHVEFQENQQRNAKKFVVK